MAQMELMFYTSGWKQFYFLKELLISEPGLSRALWIHKLEGLEWFASD